jgi:hypothetical protein
MATRKQVTCINKTDRYSAEERIRNIGGTGWKHSVENAISYIENGVYSYYVHKNGHEVDVIVASRNGRKYLKTRNDGDSPDNLLSLPECA